MGRRQRCSAALTTAAAVWAAPALAVALAGTAHATGPPTGTSLVAVQEQPLTGQSTSGDRTSRTSASDTTSRSTTATRTSTPTSGATRSASGTPSSVSRTSAEVVAPPPPTSTAAPPSAAAVRPATPPVVTAEQRSPPLVAIAVVVLVAAGVLVTRLVRHPRSAPDRTAPDDRPPPPVDPTTSAADAVVLMTVVGEAMLDSGYDVDSVRSAVADIAAVHGVPRAEIITMPTAMFASALADGKLETSAVSTGGTALLLHQTEELDAVVAGARRGELGPTAARERIRAIRELPPPFRPAARVAGNLLASAGLAVLLGGAWPDVVTAAVLGAVVGVLLLADLPRRFQVLLVVAAAFLVALGVFLTARAGLHVVVLPSLMAPLVTLLPGALLTTGVVELSTGQMISGAGRVAAGGMQLVLLALGISGAAALVGVPAVVLDTAPDPLGPLAPWIAVAAFGTGILVNRCARPRSMAWILLVLYVAYGAQVVGDVFVGGTLSAFIGAAVMTPVAALVSRQHGGPPAVVSFLPAYWLLVPGALGLAGVTTLLDGDTNGLATLVTTTATMVAISLGVLVGLAVVLAVRAAERRRPPQEHLIHSG